MVWIDMANSPHVMFFTPIVFELKSRGVNTVITARDFSETLSLIEEFGLDAVVIGKHGGKGKSGKMRAFLKRAFALYNFVKGKGIKLALSHNSYDAILAGRLAGLTVWTYMDYDRQPANHLAFRLAHKVFVQEWFPDDALRNFGAEGKAVKYKGLKEEVYLSDFKPDADFLKVLGSYRRPLVVARPPSTTSLYSKGYGTFWDVLRVLKGKGYDVRLLQRNREDEKYANEYGIPLLPKPIDGPQLLYWSDAFVGGGGTMTREAVILGTRVFTVLPSPGFLDRKLEEMGLIERLTPQIASNLKLMPRRKRKSHFFNRKLRQNLTDHILRFLGYA